MEILTRMRFAIQSAIDDGGTAHDLEKAIKHIIELHEANKSTQEALTDDCEQIIQLNSKIEQLKDANETWRIQWAATQFDNTQLKAQVNCLREALLNAITYREGTVNYGDPLEALELTQEQCLAEVKAKAIEDVTSEYEIYMKEGNFDKELVVQSVTLRAYANQLRRQAKCLQVDKV